MFSLLLILKFHSVLHPLRWYNPFCAFRNNSFIMFVKNIRTVLIMNYHYKYNANYYKQLFEFGDLFSKLAIVSL